VVARREAHNEKGYQKKEILASGRIVFIEINFHNDSLQVTVRAEEEGKEIFHGRGSQHFPGVCAGNTVRRLLSNFTN